MIESHTGTLFYPRDAAAGQQAAAAAAMSAWSAGIAYAINFIVVYLTMSLAIVVVVSAMGCIASNRVRRSPPFIILVLAAALCLCALGINVSMNKDLVVNPQKQFNAEIHTSLIALPTSFPFLVDFTLVLRILAFFARNSNAEAGRHEYKRWAAVASSSLIKIPRVILICPYIQFAHSCASIATDMANVVTRVNQEQWALMLAEELYCTTFFCLKLYQLGWGWGEDKHVSRSFLDTLKRILVSALACSVIPSILLIALIVMQALRHRPDLEGYVFATFVPMTVISAAFGQLPRLGPIHTVRSEGQSNKFLTTQRSFDTDDEQELSDKPHSLSDVELVGLDHQDVPALKRGRDSLEDRSRSTTAESKSSSLSVSVKRAIAPHSSLRHAPDVSGIAITTVTEEKWSDA